MIALVANMGQQAFSAALQALNDYAERLARQSLADITPVHTRLPI